MQKEGPTPQIQDIIVTTADQLKYETEHRDGEGNPIEFSYNAAGQYGISSDPNVSEGDKYLHPIPHGAEIALDDEIRAKSGTRFFRAQEDFEPQEEANRIVATVKQLLEHAQTLHRQIPEAQKANTITRLTTNEFMFFTKQPLTLDQFEKIQNEIYTLTKDSDNANILLVLSSFAVITDIPMAGKPPKLMNVTPHIECGEFPTFNFIVKHQKSPIDPTYPMLSSEGNEFEGMDYQYVNSINDESLVERKGIELGGVIVGFSFENVFECIMKAGVTVYSCTDICYDHFKGKAKALLEKKLQGKNEPVYCSHLLASNPIGPIVVNIIGNILTHADPRTAVPKGIVNEEARLNKKLPPLLNTLCTPTEKRIEVNFGPSVLKIFSTPPIPCSQYTPPMLTATNSSSLSHQAAPSTVGSMESISPQSLVPAKSLTWGYDTQRQQSKSQTSNETPSLTDLPTQVTKPTHS